MRSTDVTNIGTGQPEEISGIKNSSQRSPNWICKKEKINECLYKFPRNTQGQFIFKISWMRI